MKRPTSWLKSSFFALILAFMSVSAHAQSWSELSRGQQAFLGPVKGEWSGLAANHRRTLINTAEKNGVRWRDIAAELEARCVLEREGHHLPGALNEVADALSRLAQPEPKAFPKCLLDADAKSLLSMEVV